MPKICDENCPGMTCPYDVCPFLYVYQSENELCPGNSGYRYYGDPSYGRDGIYENYLCEQDRKREEELQEEAEYDRMMGGCL